VLVIIGCYTALRIAFIPDAAQYTYGFGHDSAYLAIVARNLLAGKGFVNEAQWVVFLWPASLPMPYHNGNPLFPLLVAGLSRLTGGTIFHSGFVISALSSGLLLVALTSIAAKFVSSVPKAFLIGCAAALFPGVLGDSFGFGTDGLTTALFFAFVAALVRLPARGMPVLAGVLFGLAWLARPSVVLALPAVAVYVVLRWERSGGVRLAGALALAAVVASPWLIHTYEVYRNPFRSDSGYYLLQDYYVDHDPQKWGTHYDRVLHGVTTPPGFVGVVKEDPLGLPKHLLHALPRVGKQLLYFWAMANPVGGLLMGLGVLFFLWKVARPVSPEGVALAALALTLMPVLSLRNLTFELRYFSMLTVFFAMFAAAGGLMAWEAVRRRGLWARLGVGAAGVLLWAVIVPSVVVRDIADTFHSNDAEIAYLELAHQVQRTYTGGSPVIVGKWPYFYSLETSASGLSIPWDRDRVRSDQGLFESMDKYHAPFVLLTDDELKYWRPDWSTSVPGQLEQVARLDHSRLFRLR
jgi:4-amino-4-deoxy-L-arabinose transferase-like glycosyltransferase